jgi:predicted nucleic acid-binding protein
MPTYFFDSSVVVKRYHPEPGTEAVDRLLGAPAARAFISRLTVVEVQRALVGKVRTKEISSDELKELRQGFLDDVGKRRFEVVRLTEAHYRAAEQLVYKYGPQDNAPLLRTLDALQLAVALEVSTRTQLDFFVSADTRQCEAALSEQLTVFNPVQP